MGALTTFRHLAETRNTTSKTLISGSRALGPCSRRAQARLPARSFGEPALRSTNEANHDRLLSLHPHHPNLLSRWQTFARQVSRTSPDTAAAKPRRWATT